MSFSSIERSPSGSILRSLGLDRVLSASQRPLGRKLYAWTYDPTLRDKVAALLPLLVVGALVALLLYLGRGWKWGEVVKHVLQALLGVGGGLAAQRLWVAFRKRAYELYEAGYVEEADGGGKSDGRTVRYWKDFRDCRLTEDGVRLISRGWLGLSTLLRVRGSERFVVYNLCREQIMRARSTEWSRQGAIPEAR